LSSSRGLGQQIGTVKCRFLLGRNETEVKATTTEAHFALTSVDTMETQQRNRDEYESDLVTFMRIGNISILDALAVKLPDVFAAEILTKLDFEDTLNLAQVNKTNRDAVWSVGGVRSLEAKIKAYWGIETGEKLETEPMYLAARHGNVPAVRALLESGVDVNKTYPTDDYINRRGDTTVLIIAAMLGYVAMVKLLIEKGADPNFNDMETGATALNEAATQSNPLCVMELIHAGADLDIADSWGRTPLMSAARHRGCDIIVGILINSGADVNLVDNNGMTALTYAEASAAGNLKDIPFDPRSSIRRSELTTLGMLKGTDRYPHDSSLLDSDDD
jgi:hypothetical protein